MTDALRAQPEAQDETVEQFLARGGKITRCPGPGERLPPPVETKKRKGRVQFTFAKTAPRPRPRV